MSMSEVELASSAALIKRTVTYLDLVAASVLVYDYMITFQDEAQLIWTARWSIGKILFLLTRYPVFIDTTLVLVHQFAFLSAAQCQSIFRVIGWMLGTGIGIAEIILTMRTIVIWQRNVYIMYLLPLLLIIVWIPLLYFLEESLRFLVFGPAPGPDLPGCFLVSEKGTLYLCFVLIMGFETVILALTLYKAVGQFRHANSALMVVLFRDGVLNYVYLFTLSVINVVVLLTAPRGYTTLLTGMQRVMHSILSARLLLNLRGAKRQDRPEVLMLKPGQFFPAPRPYSTQYEFTSPEFGFSSHVRSGSSDSASQARTPKSPRGLSFSSIPTPESSGSTSPTSPFHFPHPNDAPMDPTSPINPAAPQRGRNTESLRLHWAGEDEGAESSRKQRRDIIPVQADCADG